MNPTLAPVLWLPLGPGGPPSRGGQWDLALVDDVVTGTAWTPAGSVGFRSFQWRVTGDPAHPGYRDGNWFWHVAEHGYDLAPDVGAVVVVPGRYWAGHEGHLSALVAGFDWCVAVVTSDEESTFDAGWEPPNGVRWTMTPRPGVHDGNRFLGEGYRPEAPAVLAKVGEASRAGWWFCGQANHRRRHRMLAELERSSLAGTAHVTGGFCADADRGGLDAAEYLAGLAGAKVAPAPAGPATPDSFRCYEALEAGCVPVTDVGCDGYRGDGYWPMVAGGHWPPWPVVGASHPDWPSAVGEALERWPRLAAECSTWWQQHKRGLAYRVADDVRHAGGRPRAGGRLADLVTVVVTASPIPTHPGVGVLSITVKSIREQLPDAEVVVAFDGASPRLDSAQRDAYDEATRRAAWACEHRWGQAVPVLADRWVHQSGTIAAALELVRTPLVLMVEHDTPLCGDIWWEAVAEGLLGGQVDVVRFHHEAHVLEPHRYLMVDERPVDLGGFPGLRTVQWSQRPHLARTGYYRRILADHFADRAGFVEDTMHSVVQTAWNADGFAGWRRHKLALYAPPGDMKRSLHLDGRAEWDKAPPWVPRAP